MALRLTLDNEKQLPDGGPTTYVLAGKRNIEIGRDQFLDWVLPDPSRVVSGKHCEIKWQDGSYWLFDTSTNGTFLNGSEHRVQSPARLRNGDRLGVGHYLVAISIDEPEQPAPGLPRAAMPDFARGGDTPIAPPIDPALLKPAPPRAMADDFLDQAIDMPWIEPSGAPAPSPPRVDPNADWLASLAKPAPPAAPAMPPAPPPQVAPLPPVTPQEVAAPPVAPRSEDVANPWLSTPPAQPSIARLAPRPPEPAPPALPAAASPAPASEQAFLQRFAQGAGLPAGVLEGRDAGDFAESLGRLVHDMAGHVKALLDARQNARRISRTADQTTISAFDNNPLKFSPTVEDALAIMFGPPKRSYLDAARCFDSSFKDLAEHQIMTFSAMQRAIQLMQKDLEPAAVEGSVKEDKGLAAIMGSRHARLWDAYVQRWRTRTERFDDGLVGAFLRDFAACYDDPQKGR